MFMNIYTRKTVIFRNRYRSTINRPDNVDGKPKSKTF